MSTSRTDYSDPIYREVCNTARQRQVLDVVVQCEGDVHKAAEALGINHRNVYMLLARLNKYAAKRMVGQHQPNVVPEGYALKGTSTLVDADGNTKLTWVKTTVDWEKQQEIMREAVDAFTDELPVYATLPAPQERLATDVIPWFNIGDAHLGMLAHSMEVGHNFDLNIAASELVLAMKMLIDRASGYERCVIQDMGDFTHYENMAGVTEGHGHALDFDTRFQRMIRIYIQTMRTIVDYALRKFKYVDVIKNQGNHSRTNDIWMANFLRHVYQNNPRLTVLNNDSVFTAYRMGNTLVMSHHSDKCKHQKLVDVMATDFREDFGECKYKYIDIGHVHHKSVAKEYGDVIIESFNQLAPSDKYAYEGGWRSRSFLTCVLRSKTYGEVGRHVVTAEEVQDRLSLTEQPTSKSTNRVYKVD